MYTTYERLLIPITDLHRIRIGCQHCSTKVTIDLKDSGNDAPISEMCPGCRKMYDTTIPSALVALREAYRASVLPGQWIEYQIDELKK